MNDNFDFLVKMDGKFDDLSLEKMEPVCVSFDKEFLQEMFIGKSETKFSKLKKHNYIKVYQEDHILFDEIKHFYQTITGQRLYNPDVMKILIRKEVANARKFI